MGLERDCRYFRGEEARTDSQALLVPTKPSKMEVMSQEHHQQCYHPDQNESTWTTTLTSNVVLGLGFSLSCLIDEPWIWARLLLIVGYAIATHVAIINCQVETFLWTILFVLTNLYKLLKLAYDHRPSKVPRLLQARKKSATITQPLYFNLPIQTKSCNLPL